MAAFFLLLAGWEWIAELRQAPRTPWVVTIAALMASLFAVWRFVRLRQRFRDLRQGEEGERAVGQFLERLRETGYQVFHDVIGVNANIDHVLVGSAGTFTIETKTWSKPVRGDARVSFDGERVLVGGHEPDRNPVRVTVLRKEPVTVPAGTFNAIVVKPVIKTKGIFSEKGQAEVWLSDDSTRMLLQVKSKLSFGSLNLYLKSYTPAKTRN